MGKVNFDPSKVTSWQAPEGPLVMLNLYRFKSPEHRAKFQDAMPALIGPFLQEIGAEVIYHGEAGPEFVADEDWDSVALVRYPSYEALLRVFADDIGPQLIELRDSMLEKSRFMVTY